VDVHRHAHFSLLDNEYLYTHIICRGNTKLEPHI